MAVNLSKGQRATIDSSIKMALVTLGWDTNRYDGGYEFDLDASAFILGKNGKVKTENDFVFYNNQKWPNDNSPIIWSTGDDRKGGEGEQIYIDFSKLPADVDRIAITVTIDDAVNKRQNFGQVSNAYVSVAKIQNEFDTIGETVIQFDLEEEFSIETALVVCEIYRKNGEWKFNAVAAGYQGGLEALCRAYGVEVE
jgi:tellurium resistance protein TerD